MVGLNGCCSKYASVFCVDRERPPLHSFFRKDSKSRLPSVVQRGLGHPRPGFLDPDENHSSKPGVSMMKIHFLKEKRILKFVLEKSPILHKLQYQFLGCYKYTYDVAMNRCFSEVHWDKSTSCLVSPYKSNNCNYNLDK